MELKEFVLNFANILEDTEISEIDSNTNLRELHEWSSLTAMSIMSMAKLKYDRIISPTELGNCVTIEDLYKLIVSKK